MAVNYPLSLTISCEDCDDQFEVSTTRTSLVQAGKTLTSLLEDDNWSPLTIGNTCVGMLCNSCSKARIDALTKL
jgi:hypothetical protein